MSRGCFISLEGSEGMGKSTARAYIESLLQERAIDFIVTREPGGTPLAESIRTLLLHEHQEAVTVETELLLMFASRSQNIKHVIEPALSSGKWVLADRFTDASLAYQGGGRGVELSAIRSIAQLVVKGLQPDLTLLLDAPVEVGVARMQERGTKDRIEQEHVSFFERVRQQYLHMAHEEPQRYCVIDASQSLRQVQSQIKHKLTDFFKQVIV